MSVENDFVEGLDPTGLASISAAQLLQIVREAQPETNKALIIVDETEPDIASNTRFERYFWFKPTTAALKYYDGADWVAIPLQSGTVDTAQLIDAAVTLAKIDVSEGTATQLMRINAAGTGAEWWTLTLATNSVAVTKITPGTALYIPRTNAAGTSVEWVSAADLITSLAAGSISLDLLSVTGATSGKFLYYDGVNVQWLKVGYDKLDTSGLTGSRYLGTNAAGTAWELKAAPVPVEVYATSNGTYAATIDLSLTKPSGTTWKNIDMQVFFASDDIDGVNDGTIAAQFTWQTAPVAGNTCAVAAATGAGNGGHSYYANNSDDSVIASWRFVGVVDSNLVATDTITIRVSFTASGTPTNPTAYFMAKAIYV